MSTPTAPVPASVNDELKLVPAQVTATIRTVTPFLVGLVLTGLGWVLRTTGHASVMDHLPVSVREQLTTALPIILGAGYYTLARQLEKRWPRVPWLGSRAQPVYPQTPAGQPATVDPSAQATVDAVPAPDTPPTVAPSTGPTQEPAPSAPKAGSAPATDSDATPETAVEPAYTPQHAAITATASGSPTDPTVATIQGA